MSQKKKSRSESQNSTWNILWPQWPQKLTVPHTLKIASNECIFYKVWFAIPIQCWTVGAIFTFGLSQMFGHEKLQPLAIGRSWSRRIKKVKHMNICHKSFDQQSFQLNRWILQESHKKGPVLILRDNIIIIHINLRWHLCNEKHISASILEKN